MKRNGGLIRLNLPSKRNLLEKCLSPAGGLCTPILKKVSRELTAFEELAGAETGESVKDHKQGGLPVNLLNPSPHGTKSRVGTNMTQF